MRVLLACSSTILMKTGFRPIEDQAIAVSTCCRCTKAEGLCLPLAITLTAQRSGVVYLRATVHARLKWHFFGSKCSFQVAKQHVLH